MVMTRNEAWGNAREPDGASAPGCPTDFCCGLGLFQASEVTVQQPVVGANYVPITVSGEAEDRSFAATSWKAKAAVQIAGSTSLSWQAPAQLYPTATIASFRVSQFHEFGCLVNRRSQTLACTLSEPERHSHS